MQLFFFALCMFNYLLCGTVKKRKSSMDKFIDFIFASIIFPCAAVSNYSDKTRVGVTINLFILLYSL